MNFLEEFDGRITGWIIRRLSAGLKISGRILRKLSGWILKGTPKQIRKTSLNELPKKNLVSNMWRNFGQIRNQFESILQAVILGEFSRRHIELF